ncbi:hypothetical protein H0H93_012470 [Arthromyces matolae]|nr:hypothetical protein H0H93_012470 [Arthromyces matolae]
MLKKDDPRLVAALRDYHSQLMTSNKEIAQHLERDHGIVLSESSVKRARGFLDLSGGSKNLKKLDPQVAEQLVLDQLDLDSTKGAGPRTIRHRIASRKQEHLPRAFVAETMKAHDPEGFEKRTPGARKIVRVLKVPLGIHERWSCDGHDKLYKIGLPLYGFVDEATGAWLYADVAPSNRQNIIIGEIFDPDNDLQEHPAHIYLRSVHNIVVERSWGHLQIGWGKNAVSVFEQGEIDGWFDATNANHQELIQWLWAKLLRRTLKQFMDERNSYKSRKDNKKVGPSGMSRATAFKFPERWGGTDRKIKVDLDVIREIKKEMGGDTLLEFSTPEFSARAEAAYASLHVSELTFENVWNVFRALLPLLFSPGLSLPEIEAINNKPQCAGCGVVFSAIIVGICNTCVTFYRQQPDIPRDILRLRGVAQLLADDSSAEPTNGSTTSTSALASSIISQAATYRAHASDVRLNAGPPRTAAQSTNLGTKFSNLTKARQATAERQQKRAEAKLREEEKGVTVVAVLWQYDDKTKLVEVRPGVHVRRTFDRMRETKSCLDELLIQAKDDYQKLHPEAEELSWGNVQLLADGNGSANDYTSLSHLDRSRPLYEIFDEFRTQKLTTEANIKALVIKVRLVIIESETDPNYSNFTTYSRTRQSSVKTSKSLKRARAETTSIVPQSASKKYATPQSSAVRESRESLQASKVVLQSAFKPRNSAMLPPPVPLFRWSRNPPMQTYTFTRFVATISDSGEVVMTSSLEEESIEIATDWMVGEAASKEKYRTGYIGCGFTKRAIYARFRGKEFVLTQNSDEQTTPDEVKKNLSGEYEILALCDWFKQKFDEHAASRGVKTLPKFYFNYANSILGTLQALSSGSCHLPFKDFIATPLLPCGPADPNVRKFTGNDNFGDASDDMTKAIHAFVHFSMLYSQESILFCDLQGTLDSNGVMCLLLR